MPQSRKAHLLDLDLPSLEALVTSMGEPAFRAKQVREWLFRHLETDFRKMTNLPKGLQEKLAEAAEVTVLGVQDIQVSSDGTTKWAFRTHDGHVFESVLIPSEDRRSVCVSSQIGCAMGCTFCRTATMGFIRNLTLGEILEQIHFVSRHLREKEGEGARVTNVIFMGMGEPLLNLENVARACETLNSQAGFGVAKDKITISTSGLAPKILEWGRRAPDFKLAISLNGSNDRVRSELMPVNRRYPIPVLLETADEYIRLTGQKLTFEYILIRGITCTPEAARELKRIAAHRHCKINLIPLNRGEDPALQPPSEEEIREFEKILAQGDFQVLRRRPRGPDILAACGQLATEQKKKVA
ncbi:MAG TPA: 23S rRNA (adenine(2503)-C(2))-methyltransferase RlmN [Fibrobacteria bacterium]|nr:23S rRNA (adenine(2503)-C(2))-methyltransferase RlmN [Fibrobacteria bacterium]